MEGLILLLYICGLLIPYKQLKAGKEQDIYPINGSWNFKNKVLNYPLSSQTSFVLKTCDTDHQTFIYRHFLSQPQLLDGLL